ncbi:MAG: hypothetical protein D3906_07175, partial [Candidatus Electrothrix sp. AUS1_2]|nr:hypothetical protein [Candidatus Electrothrix sp. AUS1_2]
MLYSVLYYDKDIGLKDDIWVKSVWHCPMLPVVNFVLFQVPLLCPNLHALRVEGDLLPPQVPPAVNFVLFPEP